MNSASVEKWEKFNFKRKTTKKRKIKMLSISRYENKNEEIQ